MAEVGGAPGDWLHAGADERVTGRGHFLKENLKTRREFSVPFYHNSWSPQTTVSKWRLKKNQIRRNFTHICQPMPIWTTRCSTSIYCILFNTFAINSYWLHEHLAQGHRTRTQGIGRGHRTQDSRAMMTQGRVAPQPAKESLRTMTHVSGFWWLVSGLFRACDTMTHGHTEWRQQLQRWEAWCKMC